MRRVPNLIPTLLALILSAHQIEAKGSLSLYNSPKGFGASLLLPSAGDGSQILAMTVAADMYGVISGVYTDPGIRLNITRFGLSETMGGITFFAGPGFTIGHVRDFNRDDFVPSPDSFHGQGFTAALSATGGMRLSFDRSVSLAFSLSAETGIHIRKDRETSGNVLAVYKNGLYRLLFPEISIIIDL